MKNILRSARYIKLKHSINSCRNIAQLICLADIVRNHCRKNPDDNELLLEFIIKRDSFEIRFEDKGITQLQNKL